MIKTTSMLVEELRRDYRNPKCKIAGLVKDGKLTPIIRGLYETNPNVDGYLLADIIYSPSYLSFDYALHVHSMIPEAVMTYTSATCGKRRKKEYKTPFGRFTYSDVPIDIFAAEIDLNHVGGYTYWLATPEKALCDKMYSLPPVKGLKMMELTLFEDLRLYEDSFDELDASIIDELSKYYHSTNVSLLSRYLKKMRA